MVFNSFYKANSGRCGMSLYSATFIHKPLKIQDKQSPSEVNCYRFQDTLDWCRGSTSTLNKQNISNVRMSQSKSKPKSNTRLEHVGLQTLIQTDCLKTFYLYVQRCLLWGKRLNYPTAVNAAKAVLKTYSLKMAE